MNNMQDSAIEAQELNANKKRPQLLNILLILSTINIVFSFFGTTQSLINGPLSPEQLEEQTAVLYDTASDLAAKGVDREFIDIIEVMINNSIYLNNEAFYSSNFMVLITLMVGGIGVFMMRKMKKSGFHIYIIYSLLPVLTMYVITPMELIPTFSIVVLVVISAIFAVLYGINLKHMK